MRGRAHERTSRYPLDWAGLLCEARFWDWKLEPAKTHYR